MAEFAAGLGFDYACCVGPSPHSPAGYAHVFNSFPDKWAKRYEDERYFTDCHVAAHVATSSTPIVFNNARDSQKLTGRAQLRCLDARDHAISGGLVIPIHDPSGGFAAFAVGLREEGADIAPWTPVYQQVMTFAMFSHSAGLSSLRGGIMRGRAPYLTDQQRWCLHWTYEGKTAWEIGQIIGKSPATVIYHLRNASEKFGHIGKVRAAIQAKQMGLI